MLCGMHCAAVQPKIVEEYGSECLRKPPGLNSFGAHLSGRLLLPYTRFRIGE